MDSSINKEKFNKMVAQVEQCSHHQSLRAVSCRKHTHSASLHAVAAEGPGHPGDPQRSFAMTSEAPDAALAGTERKPLEVAFATGPWSAAHPTQQEAEAYQIVTESLTHLTAQKKTSS